MGVTEVLTIIFVLCKLFGVISWSWWVVFSPEIVASVIYVIIIIAQIRTAKRINKKFNKFWDEF